MAPRSTGYPQANAQGSSSPFSSLALTTSDSVCPPPATHLSEQLAERLLVAHTDYFTGGGIVDSTTPETWM